MGAARIPCGALLALCAALTLAPPAVRAGASGAAAVAAVVGPPAPAPPRSAVVPRTFAPLGPGFDAPSHGRLDAIAFGGEAEIRMGHDRVLGVGNPDWASVPRVGAFVRARLHSRVQLLGAVAWDQVTDELALERALVVARVRPTVDVHAGILLPPLGRTNLEHDAPVGDFDRRTLVATELIGVPNSQLGVGLVGYRRAAHGAILSYELDAVTGYGEGLINDSPDGTRLARGRNNLDDNNALPALAARVALETAPGTELGLAVETGPYNTTARDGVRLDDSRQMMLAVADGGARLIGLRIAGEAALALVDVPPGLEGLFAQRQWGASLEVARTLWAPILPSLAQSSLAAALRAEAADFDRDLPGDSKSRVAASLNLRPRPASVVRCGWYYALLRDRFNNAVPSAGVTLTVGSYF